MKRIVLLLLIVSLTVSCTTTKKLSQTQRQNKAETVVTRVHNGSSYKNAIVIQKKTETDGVAAEYAWLQKQYPGYRFKQQSLVYDHGKPYDVLTIVTSSGTQKEIYFDISAFFGKW